MLGVLNLLQVIMQAIMVLDIAVFVNINTYPF